MKTRTEKLREEIKRYEVLIERAKERKEKSTDYTTSELMKAWIKEYNEVIKLDEKEIREIEEQNEQNEVIKFYNKFLIKVAQTVKYVEKEIKSIRKYGGKYDLETATSVVVVELEEIRTFVGKVGF